MYDTKARQPFMPLISRWMQRALIRFPTKNTGQKLLSKVMKAECFENNYGNACNGVITSKFSIKPTGKSSQNGE